MFFFQTNVFFQIRKSTKFIHHNKNRKQVVFMLTGMMLNGIQSNPEIGYLSLLEHYRYIEVGYRMKAPKLPCWLLSTETHLTVLCSLEKSLCSASASDRVKQTFSKYDANGNGFIQEQDLENLLK